MPKVLFSNADRRVSLPNRRPLQAFIPEIFSLENQELRSLQYVFCSDDYLLKINQDFLQHDTYTDIITFDLSSGSDTEGEIYISVDRVRENAASLGIAFGEELLRVIFHGALHLCGFKDKKKSEIQVMRSKEEEYLRLFERCLRQS